jgi:hypothetical protein
MGFSTPYRNYRPTSLTDYDKCLLAVSEVGGNAYRVNPVITGTVAR